MARRKTPGIAPRTLNLDVDSYDAILEFYGRSSSGVKGQEAIRLLLKAYGLVCKEKLRRKLFAVPTDIAGLEGFAEDFIKRQLQS